MTTETNDLAPIVHMRVGLAQKDCNPLTLFHGFSKPYLNSRSQDPIQRQKETDGILARYKADGYHVSSTDTRNFTEAAIAITSNGQVTAREFLIKNGFITLFRFTGNNLSRLFFHVKVPEKDYELFPDLALQGDKPAASTDPIELEWMPSCCGARVIFGPATELKPTADEMMDRRYGTTRREGTLNRGSRRLLSPTFDEKSLMQALLCATAALTDVERLRWLYWHGFSPVMLVGKRDDPKATVLLARDRDACDLPKLCAEAARIKSLTIPEAESTTAIITAGQHAGKQLHEFNHLLTDVLK